MLHGVASAQYQEQSRMYKSRCRAARKAAHMRHISDMRDMIDHAPRRFWQQYHNKRAQVSKQGMPSAETWVEYGSRLYADTRPQGWAVPLGLQQQVQGVDPEAAAAILDAPCTEAEMNAALHRLRKGKAEDVHGLRSEYLTQLCSQQRSEDGGVVVHYTLSKYLAHAFNVCLLAGVVPDLLSWGKGCPLHKAGDPALHDHYRLITIVPLLAKVFSMVLHSRADQYLEQRQLRAPEQCGFRRQRSCTDQLFVLDHITRKYQQQGQRVYALFVDFRKAFDSVPRTLLFQRLRQLGFSPKYLQMLQAMYTSARVSFCVDGNLSSAVPTAVGVLQGDPLSPTLFGVYIDCVISHLQRICSAMGARVPHVGGRGVHGLLYADDLVLLSLDPHTAQLQLQALSNFCAFYGLEVNLQKSAAVVFRGRARRENLRLMYKGRLWPQLDSYTYLGLELSGTQGVMAGIRGLERGGHRAAMATLARCRQLHIDDAGTALKLFNSQVLPCLLYAAEVWLPYLLHDNPRGGMLDNPVLAVHDCLERVQLLFLKRLLRLRKSTPSWVVLAEVGRLPVYMYGLRRVCRYWNKLAMAEPHHLARCALIEGLEGGSNRWAAHVTRVCPQLGISLHKPVLDTTAIAPAAAMPPQGSVEEQTHGQQTAQHFTACGAALVSFRVFDLGELQLACDSLLEQWWRQWGNGEAAEAGARLRQYAGWFKQWRHLQAKHHYLFDCSMPKQLQRHLLRLRAFNLTLAVHVSKWGSSPTSATSAGPGPRCQWCGNIEDEQHVLFSCPAYAELRARYGIPCHATAELFTGRGAWQVARFVRAVLNKRQAGSESATASVVVHTPRLRRLVGAGWIAKMVAVGGLTILIATLIWALDAYRV
jgi:sorting nexin-29